MANQQKRWLTQPNSKLGKVDITQVFRKEDSWKLLSAETRQELYSLLPPLQADEKPHNMDMHPLKTQYKRYIEEELRRWQEDLRDGKETKKWREEAMKASKDRADGNWVEWVEQQKEEDWGRRDEIGLKNARLKMEEMEQPMNHEKKHENHAEELESEEGEAVDEVSVRGSS